MKKLVLKNYFLLGNPNRKVESLQQWLFKQSFHGKESRARTRFIKMLGDRIEELDKERERLLKEHSKKKKVKQTTEEDGKKETKEVEKVVYLDEEGNETTDKKKSQQYKLEKPKKFQEEWLKYLNEDFIIDVTPSTNKTIYGVRDILLNTDKEFSEARAARYDEICRSFEEIK